MIQARYPGKCQRCKGSIDVGDSINIFNRPYKGATYHVACPGNNPVITDEGMPESTDVNPAADRLLSSLIDAVAERVPPSIDEDAVRRIAHEVMSGTERAITVEIQQSGKPTVVVKDAHRTLPRLLAHLGRRRHVYLWGPPGSGKSTAVRIAAEALGLPYYYRSLSPMAAPSSIEGFVDVNGVYRDTEFVRRYTEGGVVCLEEGDNMSSALAVTLNVALDNGHASYPGGMVARHADFVLVLCANTAGRGGDVMFPERRPLDAAFLNRFAIVHWDYDDVHERQLALAVNPNCGSWVSYVQGVRDWARKNSKRIMATPRASIYGGEALAQGDTFKQVATEWLYGSIDADLKREALTANPLPGVE